MLPPHRFTVPNLAYGMLPGNAPTQADAVRAYVQSTLKSKHDTWVTIPPLLQPKGWRGKYNRPTGRPTSLQPSGDAVESQLTCIRLHFT